MGQNSRIEWTTHTWNPWYGCTKVSPGCKLCYMDRWAYMSGRNPEVVTRASEHSWNQPLSKKWSEPAFVFTCSLSDFFHEASDGWRDEAWEVIRRTPHLTYQILTKRPERIADHLPIDWTTGYPNVWLGVSTENQQFADERIPLLLRIRAKTHFISAEPLLGPIDLSRYINGMVYKRLDWVITGGESGPIEKVRHLEIDWIDSLVVQCTNMKVPIFVKQLGRQPHRGAHTYHLKDEKGGDMNEWPNWIRVRQMPEV